MALQCGRGITASENMSHGDAYADFLAALQCGRGITASENRGEAAIAQAGEALQCGRGITASEN